MPIAHEEESTSASRIRRVVLGWIMCSPLSELRHCTCIAVRKCETGDQAAARVSARPALKCFRCARANGWRDREASIGRRQSEVERRPRPRRRLHPHPAAVPLDGLPAECESQPAAGVFSSVQASEHAEDPRLECRIDAGAAVSHGKHPLGVLASGRNVHCRRMCVEVFDGVP